MISYKQIMKQISNAEKNRQKWINYINVCYKYFLPEREDNGAHIGSDLGAGLYASIGVDSLAEYASKIESKLTPPKTNWAKLEMGSQLSKNIKENETNHLNILLEKMTEIVFDHIHSSNFASQINECYLELGISLGALIIETGDGIQSGLHFRAVPIHDLLINESGSGKVDNVFRDLKLQVQDLADIFPKIKKEDWSSDVQKHIIENPSYEVELYEGTIKLENGKYALFVIEKKAKTVTYIEEVDVNPWVIFREATLVNSPYGRGRAMRALPTIKTLNQVYEDFFKTAEFKANPIFTVMDDGVINTDTITIESGTVIPVGHEQSLRALEVGGDLNISVNIIEKLENEVRQTLLARPFGEIDNTPVRTATEMQIRNAEYAEATMSASGRVTVELLEQIIAKSVELLKQQGFLPDMKVDGKQIGVKIVSPIGLQQNEIDIANVGKAMQLSNELAGGQATLASIKIEEIPKFLMQKVGAPAELIREDAEKNQILQSLMAQQQQGQ